jgi:hypothetical protein
MANKAFMGKINPDKTPGEKLFDEEVNKGLIIVGANGGHVEWEELTPTTKKGFESRAAGPTPTPGQQMYENWRAGATYPDSLPWGELEPWVKEGWESKARADLSPKFSISLGHKMYEAQREDDDPAWECLPKESRQLWEIAAVPKPASNYTAPNSGSAPLSGQTSGDA